MEHNFHNDRPANPETENVTRFGRILFASVLSIIITLIITISFTQAYGYALYIGVPFTIGFIFGFTLKTRKFIKSLSIVALITVMFSLLLILIKVEGAICIIMIIVPLYFFILMGYALGHVFRQMNLQKNTTAVVCLFLINPACITIDTQASMTDNQVASSLIIQAPVHKVWQVITHPVNYNNHSNFFFRNGVNYPKKMQLMSRNDSLFLHCELRNGATDLHVTKLVTDERMRFTIVEHVEPMKELTIYDSLSTPHTHDEYFRLHYGEFELVPAGKDQCKLVARSDFSYKLSPATYWNWWSRYLVNKMHLQVLNRIKNLSEQK